MPGPTLEFEIRSGFPVRFIAGIDEVGRGCLAGPVVACALVLPKNLVLERAPEFVSLITDSKALTEAKREALFPLIQEWCADYAIGEASVEEIDRINIYHASHLAMTRAVAGLKKHRPDHLLVDGNVCPVGLRDAYEFTTVVKGDLRCLSIAAASILAKVWRDRMMLKLDLEFPGYGLAKHKGYGTPVHLKALTSLGPTPLHRQSFRPVAEAALKA